MRVLLTNMQLCGRSGTELYVFELAVELARRGDLPVVYSPHLGLLAKQLQSRSIPVVRDLDRISVAPDIIHGNHNLQTISAICHFPNTPAVMTCHDCSAWHDHPVAHPRIRKYLAVDHACRERLIQMEGIDPRRIEVAYNGVDLDKFEPRGPLPKRPKKALLFSNYSEDRAFRVIRNACRRHEVELHAAGRRLGGAIEQPELTLRNYDLVFAKGRAAWESLAVGNSVIVCDGEKLGGLVTRERLDQMRAWNFGRRLLQSNLTIADVSKEVSHYDAEDAAHVRDEVRKTAGLKAATANLLTIYESILNEPIRSDVQMESKSVASFLHWLSEHQRDLAAEITERRSVSHTVQRWVSSLKRRWVVRGRKAA